jgi:hypothetical protein
LPDVVEVLSAPVTRADVYDLEQGRLRYFLATPRGEGPDGASGRGFQRARGTIYDLALSIDADGPLDVAAAEQLIEDLHAAPEELRRLAR